jgi:hypothetical protein
MDSTGYSFVPERNAGASSPKFEGERCQGRDLRNVVYVPEFGLDLQYLHSAYHAYVHQGLDTVKPFFTSFMDKLAGGTSLEDALVAGRSVPEIKASWEADLQAYKEVRARYLLYPPAPILVPQELPKGAAPAKKSKKATKKGAQ